MSHRTAFHNHTPLTVPKVIKTNMTLHWKEKDRINGKERESLFPRALSQKNSLWHWPSSRSRSPGGRIELKNQRERIRGDLTPRGYEPPHSIPTNHLSPSTGAFPVSPRARTSPHLHAGTQYRTRKVRSVQSEARFLKWCTEREEAACINKFSARENL